MVESTKRPERLAWIAFALSLMLLLFTSGLSGVWAKSYLIYSSVFPLTAAMLMALVGAWRCYLMRKEREEAEERDRVKREFDREDLFDDRDDALKLAEGARKQFDTWAVPIFTFLLCAGLIGIAMAVNVQWRGLLAPEKAQMLADKLAARNPEQATGVAVFMLLATLLLGAYLNGISREHNSRWVRPVAQWMLFSSFVFFVTLVVTVIELVAKRNPAFTAGPRLEIHVANLLLLLVVALGIELLIGLIIDFYRPRTADTEIRPLYESRILGVITEPGSIAHNVAHALDYQFGFKVSETWFYSFVEKSFVPFVIILSVTFYLLSCFALVRHDEMAIKLRWGRAQEGVYGPGLKVKWPWPIDRFQVFPVKRAQRLVIGVSEYKKGEMPDTPPDEENAGDPTGRVTLWTARHNKEETKYLTAAKSRLKAETEGEAKRLEERRKAVPTNITSVNMTVNFTIDPDQLHQYAFNYENPVLVLEEVCKREVMAFLATQDLVEVIGPKYLQTQEEFSKRVRAVVDEMATDPERSLGIKITRVLLVEVHPPIEVAEAFQNVIIAQEKKHRMVLEAKRYYDVTMQEAKGDEAELLAKAETYRDRRMTEPQAQVARFEAQLENFQAAPDVFRMRELLNVLLSLAESDDIPRYVIATPHAKRVTELMFKEKALNLGDLDTEEQLP